MSEIIVIQREITYNKYYLKPYIVFIVCYFSLNHNDLTHKKNPNRNKMRLGFIAFTITIKLLIANVVLISIFPEHP